MGASGSGKSTLLNVLGLLDRYDEGEYSLDGVDMSDLSETQAARYRGQFIGFVFQSFHLIPFKTAAENVALPLYYQGVPRRERNRVAEEYLEQVGLADRAGTCRASSPAASSSAWRSPARWSRSPRCSSPTSRPARSTRETS